MEHTFITIADVTEKTGRSASTVRRLIHTITTTKDHPDRDAVQPTPAEVNAFKKKGENFTWHIREDVALKHFNAAPKQAKKPATEMSGDILSILQKELDLKSQQIEKQWEVIHALNDRLREGNILMGSLQKRLSLPSPEASEGPVVEATASKASAEPAKAASGKSKKGIFGWMKR